jgi:methylmalonyl-CoA mutase N-terminal domain/subunit
MYTTHPWTIRQYAGYGSAAESNQRYRKLLDEGSTGLSVAFDLPTQMGMDSDAALAHGEVGRVGVAIDSIEDMRRLFDGIDLGAVSTSMTINAPAAVLLVLYELVGNERGTKSDQLRGTIQNDVLKEYISRGTYIFPPAASMRLAVDTIEYASQHLPAFNPISVSGYHMSEAGATPVQEVAFTLANAIAYVESAITRGLAVDTFAPRLSFFFVARETLLEEVAKFRAARRLWARIMRERFGSKDPKSQMLRFHTQTAGVQLSAQQPEVNLIRVTVQAIAAALGGTQSLHTNSFDEALGLPTVDAARLAVRTQQVLQNETDLTRTVDPFAGSYAIEKMTDELESAASDLIARIDQMGGAIAGVEAGFQKSEIEQSAYRFSHELESGSRVIVGVNAFTETDTAPEAFEPLRVDPAIEAEQVARLAQLKAKRDNDAVSQALTELASAAATPKTNVVPFLREALAKQATVGEVCQVLRDEWGTYQPNEKF